MYKRLYPKTLVDRDLNFAESIYALAFGLEDEVRNRGKEAVFRELGMAPEEMQVRVDDCLDRKMYPCSAYALRRVLGDAGSVARDEELFQGLDSLSGAFGRAVDTLRSSDTGRGEAINFRHLLTEGKSLGSNSNGLSSNAPIEQVCAQVQQLMGEVRYHDEQRDLALARIEELMVQIQQREDCPDWLGEKAQDRVAIREVSLDGAVTQLRWPYRSYAILRELRLRTVRETVEYFQDFTHFVEGKDITLMEWTVITEILSRSGLLSRGNEYDGGLDARVDEAFDFSVRIGNCLRRGRDISNVDDLMMNFADGAAEGWEQIQYTRNLGRKLYEVIVQRLGETHIKLNDETCFPTLASSVQVLDFNRKMRRRLRACEILTVGELLAACQDDNRFSGLRHVDDELYREARGCLVRYGFIGNS